MGFLMVIWVGATWMEFITTGITFVCDLAGGQLQEVFWRLKYERREEVLRPTDLDRRADSSERSRLTPCWPRFGVLRLGMLIYMTTFRQIGTSIGQIHWTELWCSLTWVDAFSIDQHLAQLSPAIARPSPPSRAKPNFKHLGSLGSFDSGSGTPQSHGLFLYPLDEMMNLRIYDLCI